MIGTRSYGDEGTHTSVGSLGWFRFGVAIKSACVMKIEMNEYKSLGKLE